MAVQPEILDAYDERQLVAAFQDGDEGAFARIVAAHYHSLVSEARRRLRSSGDAEDAVQETLLRAYLALDRFGGDFRLRAWLSRILANTCADIRARQSGELRLFDRLSARRELVPPTDDDLSDEELRSKVQQAVGSLPDAYRTAFVLREVEELPYAQVAEKLAVSEPNARARVHRARGALQRTLKSVGGTLGALALPLRLVSGRLTRHDRKSVRPAHFSVSSDSLGQAAQAPQSAQLSPLSQVGQTLLQAASSPVSQAVAIVGSETSRAAIPVAGMIASIAAGAAAITSGAALVSTPAAAPSTSTSTSTSAEASLAGLTAFNPLTIPQAGSTAEEPASSATTGMTLAPSDPVSTSSVTTQGPTTETVNVTGAPAGIDWTWVSEAATTDSGANSAPSTSTPAGPSSSPASGQPAATPPAACDLSSLGAAQGEPALPAPESAGAAPASYFASNTLQSSGTSDVFQASGNGLYSESGNFATLYIDYGACDANTTAPSFFATLSDAQGSGLGEVQLSGALVSSSSTGGETVLLYRGEAQLVNDPNGPSVEFAARVELDPGGITTLRLALFGEFDQFFEPAGCVSVTASVGGCGTGSTASTGGSSPSTAQTGASDSPNSTSDSSSGSSSSITNDATSANSSTSPSGSTNETSNEGVGASSQSSSATQGTG